jgi:hypothetical protein
MINVTWEQVRDKLEALLEETRAKEPFAVNYIDALEKVLEGLPGDGEE